MALYRGWISGLDLKSLADRYLETGIDLRVARSTIVWIRDTLTQAALRHSRRADARLLRVRLKDINQPESLPYPTLESYRAEKDPGNFYREEELIKIYLSEYPQAADKKERHRKRLMERQLAALAWVEPLLITDPVPEDPVSAWFDKTISDRLALAKIPTIGALRQTIRERGYRWWIDVPRLGEKGAKRIVDWLQSYDDSLPSHALAPTRSLAAQELVKQRDRETAIVPIEAFVVPPMLSGESGSNRQFGRARIEAANDLQAIHSWLQTKSGSANTVRAYRKEAERLILWAVIERQKALSDLTVEDCTAYRDWIAMLGRTSADEWPYRIPQDNWIGKRNSARFSTNWRPFDGALSSNSVRQALTILAGMFEWLVRVQYCAFNPWDAVNKKVSGASDTPVDIELGRVFSKGQWNYLLKHVETLPDQKGLRIIRLKFVLAFAYVTGLRLSELVDATTGRLYTMPLRDDSLEVRWMLKVRGKGDKWRAAPLLDSTLTMLREYLDARGLDPDPLENPAGTPIISRLQDNEPMSPSGLYKVFGEVFQSAADALLREKKNQEAKDFSRASTHWIRHTRGSHLGIDGVSPTMIQKLLGHASLTTTSIYTDTDEEQLWKVLDGMEAEHAR
jgi:site-specific recombinase XerD